MVNLRIWRGRRELVVAVAWLALASLSASAAGETAEASRAKTVRIANFAFHPATLTIARGTRVAFANASRVTHTATRAGVFDTRRIKPGTSAVVRFRQRGTFRYHCKIHPFMHGKIVVE